MREASERLHRVALVDIRQLLKRYEIPHLGVRAFLSGCERSKLAKRLQLGQKRVGEGLIVAAAVGIILFRVKRYLYGQQ